MARKKKMSAVDAALDVLEQEGHPLHVGEIAERVLKNYDTGLKGATPAATLAAQLYTLAARGEKVRKTKPGTFTLRAQARPHPKPSKTRGGRAQRVPVA